MGVHDIAIVTVPPGPLQSDEKAAEWNSDANTITMGADTPVTRQVTLFFHEMVHCFLNGLVDAGLTEEMEELVAVTLGEGLAAFVRSNPILVLDIVKALTQEE